MNKKDVIFSIFLIILISFTFWRFANNFKKYSTTASVSIVTQRKDYQNGEILELKITNNSGKKFCFSTCYPYLLEKKDKAWETYKYVECDRDNIHNGCIENGKEKGFELTLPKSISGLHRLAVPVCSECKEGETFKEESRFYSNEFIVK